MAGGWEVPLRQRLCRHQGCGAVFYVCRSCGGIAVEGRQVGHAAATLIRHAQGNQASPVLSLAVPMVRPAFRAPLVSAIRRTLLRQPPRPSASKRAVALAPVTGAANAHRRPAPRARELPRLGIRHRTGVPRAGQTPRSARSSMRFTVDRATAAVTRRPGISPRASTLFRTPLRLPRRRPSRQLLRATSGGSLLTSTPLAFLASV